MFYLNSQVSEICEPIQIRKINISPFVPEIKPKGVELSSDSSELDLKDAVDKAFDSIF